MQGDSAQQAHKGVAGKASAGEGCRAGVSVPSGSGSLSGVPAFFLYAAPAATLLRSFQSPDSVFPASHSAHGFEECYEENSGI